MTFYIQNETHGVRPEIENNTIIWCLYNKLTGTRRPFKSQRKALKKLRKGSK